MREFHYFFSLSTFSVDPLLFYFTLLLIYAAIKTDLIAGTVCAYCISLNLCGQKSVQC